MDLTSKMRTQRSRSRMETLLDVVKMTIRPMRLSADVRRMSVSSACLISCDYNRLLEHVNELGNGQAPQDRIRIEDLLVELYWHT